MENEVAIARGKDTTSFYVEARDGHGNIERQLNFENPKVCPRKGLIELIPLKERKGFDNRVMFRRVLDKESRTWVGIPTQIDPLTKNFIYTLITVIGRRIYDLSNDKDAREWACIKHSPYLEGSPNQDRNTPPIYKVYDKEKQAIENLEKTKFKRKAAVVADGLNGSDLDDMLRTCGIGVVGMSEIMKQYAIIQFAEEHPETFLKHWDSPTRREGFILKQAVELDLVQNDPNIGFIYRTLSLGLNEQEAVTYLKDHQQISTALDSLIMQKKEDTLKSNVVAEAPTSNNASIALQEANDKIRALEAMIEKQSNKAIEAEAGVSLEGNAPNPNLDTLKAQAKALGIKGWHLAKDKYELQRKINEAEAKK